MRLGLIGSTGHWQTYKWGKTRADSLLSGLRQSGGLPADDGERREKLRRTLFFSRKQRRATVSFSAGPQLCSVLTIVECRTDTAGCRPTAAPRYLAAGGTPVSVGLHR